MSLVKLAASVASEGATHYDETEWTPAQKALATGSALGAGTGLALLAAGRATGQKITEQLGELQKYQRGRLRSALARIRTLVSRRAREAEKARSEKIEKLVSKIEELAEKKRKSDLAGKLSLAGAGLAGTTLYLARQRARQRKRRRELAQNPRIFVTSPSSSVILSSEQPR